MPRWLRQRCRPYDSILEFRAAARERYHDGLALALRGRRTGAIYLWGYTAEMILKAAYFDFLGLPETRPLSVHLHLLPAIARARNQLNIPWPTAGAGHQVECWAELLVRERALSAQHAHPLPLAHAIQQRGQRMALLWKETLRYKRNFAYQHELTHARETAEWFLAHASQL